MGELDGADAAALRTALSEVEDAKAVKRLMIAIAYDDGVPVSTLSERYGVATSTLYHWLSRFEERTPVEAATDDPRPGRTGKLSPDQRREVRAALEEPPSSVGVDGEAWTPALLRSFIAEEYGVVYSIGYLRERFGVSSG